MSLQTRLEAVVAAIGADIKQLKATSGGGATAGPAGIKVSELPLVSSLNWDDSFPVVQNGSKRGQIYMLRPWSEQILGTTYVNGTTTATNVFDGFTPAPNSAYLVDVLLIAQSNATGSGIQTALAGPTTGITRSAVKINTASGAAADMISHLALNGFQVAINSLTTPHLIYQHAIIETGATVGAGNIRVQARTEIAATNAVQIFRGSSMRWRSL